MFGHDDQHDQHQDSQVVQPQPSDDLAIGLGDDSNDHPQAASAPPVPSPISLPRSDDTAMSGVDEVASGEDMGEPVHVSIGQADDLLSIKQQALQHLSPLVGHLDQTPEEKFKTTMMMIQASDDQTMVKTAYEAAQAITDEKTRAQALLDVVNEINYFTQKTTADKN